MTDERRSILVNTLVELFSEVVVEAVTVILNSTQERSPGPFTAKEAADYLNMKIGTLYHHTSRGSIPYHRVGKHIYFYQNELDNWIRSDGKIKDYTKSS